MAIFNLYELVKSKIDLESVPKGTLGTILIIYEGGNDFEVEFADKQGNTINILTVNKDNLEAANGKNE